MSSNEDNVAITSPASDEDDEGVAGGVDDAQGNKNSVEMSPPLESDDIDDEEMLLRESDEEDDVCTASEAKRAKLDTTSDNIDEAPAEAVSTTLTADDEDNDVCRRDADESSLNGDDDVGVDDQLLSDDDFKNRPELSPSKREETEDPTSTPQEQEDSAEMDSAAVKAECQQMADEHVDEEKPSDPENYSTGRPAAKTTTAVDGDLGAEVGTAAGDVAETDPSEPLSTEGGDVEADVVDANHRQSLTFTVNTDDEDATGVVADEAAKSGDEEHCEPGDSGAHDGGRGVQADGGDVDDDQHLDVNLLELTVFKVEDEIATLRAMEKQKEREWDEVLRKRLAKEEMRERLRRRLSVLKTIYRRRQRLKNGDVHQEEDEDSCHVASRVVQNGFSDSDEIVCERVVLPSTAKPTPPHVSDLLSVRRSSSPVESTLSNARRQHFSGEHSVQTSARAANSFSISSAMTTIDRPVLLPRIDSSVVSSSSPGGGGGGSLGAGVGGSAPTGRFGPVINVKSLIANYFRNGTSEPEDTSSKRVSHQQPANHSAQSHQQPIGNQIDTAIRRYSAHQSQNSSLQARPSLISSSSSPSLAISSSNNHTPLSTANHQPNHASHPTFSQSNHASLSTGQSNAGIKRRRTNQNNVPSSTTPLGGGGGSIWNDILDSGGVEQRGGGLLGGAGDPGLSSTTQGVVSFKDMLVRMAQISQSKANNQQLPVPGQLLTNSGSLLSPLRQRSGSASLAAGATSSSARSTPASGDTLTLAGLLQRSGNASRAAAAAGNATVSASSSHSSPDGYASDDDGGSDGGSADNSGRLVIDDQRTSLLSSSSASSVSVSTYAQLLNSMAASAAAAAAGGVANGGKNLTTIGGGGTLNLTAMGGGASATMKATNSAPVGSGSGASRKTGGGAQSAIKNKASSAAAAGVAVSSSSVPMCQGCDAKTAQFVCAGCSSQWYCSKECQVNAWDEHSEYCTG